MAVFRVALLNECIKLYKKKKVLLALILSVAIIILGQVILFGVRSGLGIRGAGSVEFPILVLSVAVNTILPLFTALIAIDTFSGEFSQHTLSITLTRPVSRFKIFTAKVMAVTGFFLSNLLFLLIFSLLAGYLFNVNSTSFGSFSRTVVAFLVTLLPMLVLTLLIVLLANIFKSGITVFFASILVYILMQILGMTFAKCYNLLPTSYLDWYNLWLADSLPLGKIFREFLLMLGYGMMLFTAGFYLFDKREA